MTAPVRPPREDPFCILGIETSCDETAASVVANGAAVLSSVVSSQVDLHARFGGVVPELAGRAHVELLTPVVAEALVEAGLDGDGIGAVAATVGPGLIGSLLVGLSAAKALALVWDVPFVGVNHLEAHLFAAFLEEPDLEPPLVVLLVSGGHTQLVVMEGYGRYRLLGARWTMPPARRSTRSPGSSASATRAGRRSTASPWRATRRRSRSHGP
jgi:N6-L-threonylcarbamoyladenine synthase